MSHTEARTAAAQLSEHLKQHARQHSGIDHIDLTLALSVLHSALNQIDPPRLADHPSAALVFQTAFLGDPHK
jgi:hypothetical protein